MMENKVCIKCRTKYPNHKMSCKIPHEEWVLTTAEEFLATEFMGMYGPDRLVHIRLLQEFAKLHVEAALKAVNKMGKETWDWTTEECNSILEDAYPLDNIK